MSADAEQKSGGAGAGAGQGADAGQGGAAGQGGSGAAAGGSGKPGDAGQQGAGGTETDTQKAINAVVARERAAAEKREAELTRRIAELEQKVTGGQPKKAGAEDDAAFRQKVEEARKPLETELEGERKARTALNDRLVRTELKAAAKDSVDADDVADRLAARVKVNEKGEFEVVDKDGKPEYGAKGPKTLSELVAELYAQKPYLAKSTARDGIDFNGAKRSGATGDIDAQIAEAEKAGNFVLAGNLKAQKLEQTAKR